ncbi:hypothetical protein GCM10027280_36270 [Micromonospora polyrhachis]|uniref:LCP family protein required for cell wall assembly n=1 Tax=Micromonospora polyrhachis TaxID=1282883 RepID=A0A7W7SPX4_9ACTN|nr:LCP family protein [Micromonospora polyrhachis]MBB4958769.1 LCP family protein required for cell wall assembly [Micromonospora polyrhachis]
MIEDDLRRSFAQHETLTPDPGPVRSAIDTMVVRRRRRQLKVRAAGTALAVLLAVLVPVVGRDLVATPESAPVGGPSVVTPPAVVLPDTALNFLLIGVDGQLVADTGNRADSMTIVHIPRDRSRVYLISLPRDLGVEIPGHGFNKLNAAFLYGSLRPGAKPDMSGGLQLTVRTVAELTGLRVDGSAVLTFSGLRTLTDAVGGVKICLPEQVKSIHTGRLFPADCQQLDGAAALDLLRQRVTLRQGAHDRDRNGHLFLQALVAKLASGGIGNDPAKLLAILQTVGDGAVVDTGDLPPVDLFVAFQGPAAKSVGIGWPDRTQTSDEKRAGTLDPAGGASLFTALRQDAVADWAAKNREFVTS